MRNSIRGRQRTRQRWKWVIVASGSILLLSAAIFIYLNLSESETSEAAVIKELDPRNLPVDIKVANEFIAAPEETARHGRFKKARPLSETPEYPSKQ
jgi:hypothetical protein